MAQPTRIICDFPPIYTHHKSTLPLYRGKSSESGKTCDYAMASRRQMKTDWEYFYKETVCETLSFCSLKDIDYLALLNREHAVATPNYFRSSGAFLLWSGTTESAWSEFTSDKICVYCPNSRFLDIWCAKKSKQNSYVFHIPILQNPVILAFDFKLFYISLQF